MSPQKNILITFLGNIDYDTRCFNLFTSLNNSNFNVNFLGFDWLTENFKTIKGKKTTYRLKKNFPTIFFYLKFFIILKLNLLKKKFDIVFAEDLYTLPVSIIVGKIKGAKVIYDCRELYGYLAGLKDRPFVQKLWNWIEKFFITKADLVITTGELDAEFLIKEYKIKNICVIRNLPLYKKPIKPINFYEKFKIDSSKKILLYQGIVVHGRGLEFIFKVLANSHNFVLIILGSGEHLNFYKNLTKKLQIDNKVYFAGKIKQNDLINYTAGAYIGLSLIENTTLSHYYALPNKLFEYIMAEIPVITTDLPQMKKIVDEYKVGFTVKENDIEGINSILSKLMQDQSLYAEIKNNSQKASTILCWENEFKILLNKIHRFFS